MPLPNPLGKAVEVGPFSSIAQSPSCMLLSRASGFSWILSVCKPLMQNHPFIQGLKMRIPDIIPVARGVDKLRSHAYLSYNPPPLSLGFNATPVNHLLFLSPHTLNPTVAWDSLARPKPCLARFDRAAPLGVGQVSEPYSNQLKLALWFLVP